MAVYESPKHNYKALNIATIDIDFLNKNSLHTRKHTQLQQTQRYFSATKRTYKKPTPS